MRPFPLNHRRILAPVAIAALALAAALAMTQLASAQADPQATEEVIFDNTSGPYTLKITQSPPEPVVGSVRIAVTPVETATGEPVTNAIIRVFGNPSEEGERQYAPALNSPVEPSIYIAQLELEHPGIWGIEVEVDADPGLSVAIAQLAVRERARSGDSATVGTALFVLISVGFVGGGLWLWYSSKKARARKARMISSGRAPRASG